MFFFKVAYLNDLNLACDDNYTKILKGLCKVLLPQETTPSLKQGVFCRNTKSFSLILNEPLEGLWGQKQQEGVT